MTFRQRLLFWANDWNYKKTEKISQAIGIFEEYFSYFHPRSPYMVRLIWENPNVHSKDVQSIVNMNTNENRYFQTIFDSFKKD